MCGSCARCEKSGKFSEVLKDLRNSGPTERFNGSLEMPTRRGSGKC